jgi:acetyl esterase/lipase
MDHLKKIKSIVVSIMLTFFVLSTCAQTSAKSATEEIASYNLPNAILLHPNAKIEGPGEQWDKYYGSLIVRNVVTPTLTPFLPDPSKATGAAIIVAPGGAFMELVMDAEGYKVAQWLADHGVAAFVLKYRLKSTARDLQVFDGDLLKLLGELKTLKKENKPMPTISLPEFALEDAKTAVRLVRSRAAEWEIDPTRVGFIGFSAGAITTLGVGLTPDAVERPDFIAAIYGPMNEINVPSYAPPAFIAIALDDPIFGGDCSGLINSWQKANCPVEAHLYGKGGHGFATVKRGNTTDMWMEEFYAWMKSRRLLKNDK